MTVIEANALVCFRTSDLPDVLSRRKLKQPTGDQDLPWRQHMPNLAKPSFLGFFKRRWSIVDLLSPEPARLSRLFLWPNKPLPRLYCFCLKNYFRTSFQWVKQIHPVIGIACSSYHHLTMFSISINYDYSRYVTIKISSIPLPLFVTGHIQYKHKANWNTCVQVDTTTTQWAAPPQWNIIHWYSGHQRQNGCCIASGVGKNAALWQKLWRAVRLNNVGNSSRGVCSALMTTSSLIVRPQICVRISNGATYNNHLIANECDWQLKLNL